MARASRIALDMALEASKKLKPALGTAWQYAKTEIVPPMTLNFFHGPKGKNLEDTISKAADNFIAGIQNKINDTEAEKLREIKRKEAAVKALVEKLKAEAKRKAEEARKKAVETAKKVKAEAQKKAQAVTKTASDVKNKVEGNLTKRKPPGNRFRSILLNEVNGAYAIPVLQQRTNQLKEFLQDKSKKTLQSKWGQKIRDAKGFYQLEMSPPKFDEMKKLKEDLILVKDFIGNGCFKYITVKQAWLLFLVSLEIMLWFFLGETIGKMHIVGYKV
ncbi:unnamed protein product [Euphydryas editha]|uniref:Uncharacterized protein n=1 Tax=Euphydryas editha TaxID=104508 RepID=A0AAU9UN79_EUPED|nr:unnamed protein product [Euphydryas editha]